MGITEIYKKLMSYPTSELEKDLQETDEDIKNCETALKLGVTEYSGGSVQERLDKNLKIKKVIEGELERRKQGGV